MGDRLSEIQESAQQSQGLADQHSENSSQDQSHAMRDRSRDNGVKSSADDDVAGEPLENSNRPDDQEPKSYSRDQPEAGQSEFLSGQPTKTQWSEKHSSPADRARSPKSDRSDREELQQDSREGLRSRSVSPSKQRSPPRPPPRVVSMDRNASPPGGRHTRREGPAPYYNRERFSPPCRSPRRYRTNNYRSKEYYTSGGGGRRRVSSQSPSPQRRRRYDYTGKLDYQTRPRNDDTYRQYRDNEPRKTPRDPDDTYRNRGGFHPNDRRRSFDNRRRMPGDAANRDGEGRNDRSCFGENDNRDRARDYLEDRGINPRRGGDRDYSTRWNKFDGYRGQRGPRREKEFEPRRRLNDAADEPRVDVDVCKEDLSPREKPMVQREKPSSFDDGGERQLERRRSLDREARRDYGRERDIEREGKRSYDRQRRPSPVMERRPSLEGDNAPSPHKDRLRDYDRDHREADRSGDRDYRRGPLKKGGDSLEGQSPWNNEKDSRRNPARDDRTGGGVEENGTLRYNARSMIRETSFERLRRREIEREFRLERANVKYKKVRRDEDRDISERIALGQAQASAQETLFDARLFNRDGDTGAPNITTADDDDYVLYDKPLFAARTRRPF